MILNHINYDRQSSRLNSQQVSFSFFFRQGLKVTLSMLLSTTHNIDKCQLIIDVDMIRMLYEIKLINDYGQRSN